MATALPGLLLGNRQHARDLFHSDIATIINAIAYRTSTSSERVAITLFAAQGTHYLWKQDSFKTKMWSITATPSYVGIDVVTTDF